MSSLRHRSIGIAAIVIRAMILPCFAFTCVRTTAQLDSTRMKIVQDISYALRSTYLDRYMAEVMVDSITALYDGGHYDELIYSDEFVHGLTETLRAISGDRHITVRMAHPYTGTKRKVIRSWKIRPLERLRNRMRDRKYRRRTGKDMFDYGIVAILPGSIGYLQLFSFDRTRWNREYNRQNRISWSSIVRELQGTNGLIVDLRQHHGGGIDMEQIFLSSFIKERGRYIGTSESWHDHRWTRKRGTECLKKEYHTNGKNRFNSVEKRRIIALTSSYTFSAGEGAAYGLQKRANAIIIGEATAGAGNGAPLGGYSTPYVDMQIPTTFYYDEENQGFTIEGAGVDPDVLVPADSSLLVAYRKFGGQGSMESAFGAAEYIHKPPAPEAPPLVIPPDECELLCGDFRFVQVQCKDEGLYVSFDLGVPARVLTDETGRYKFKGLELTFLREADGRAREVHIVHPDGYVEKHRRRGTIMLSSE